jgi:hypothetical protein
MTNALYEGIDKQLAEKDAEIAALRKALALIWAWVYDTELERALLIAGMHNVPSGPRLGNLLAEARHAKDVALALLTSG